jgi:tRNA A37 threonylcarbamoyltransferase TsaD
MGKNNELFPRVFLDKKRFDFSFSGLKSAVKREIDNRKLNIIREENPDIPEEEIKNIFKTKNKDICLSEKDICEIAYEFENAVIEVLAYKLIY